MLSSSAGVAVGPPIRIAGSPGTSFISPNEITLTRISTGIDCSSRERM